MLVTTRGCEWAVSGRGVGLRGNRQPQVSWNGLSSRQRSLLCIMKVLKAPGEGGGGGTLVV